MILGNPDAWLNRFRSIDVKFLQCVERIWPRCLENIPKQPSEDSITINLVELLAKDRETCRLVHWIEYQFEPFGYNESGSAFSKGKIDMAAILDQNRDHYLAYECKRLNAVRDNGRSSLAVPYVREGVSRFVTEKYAEGLPLGCMLGYILDGDINFAVARLRCAIVEFAQETNLIGEISNLDALKSITCFATRHNRSKGTSEIEVRHALLSFPVLR